MTILPGHEPGASDILNNNPLPEKLPTDSVEATALRTRLTGNTDYMKDWATNKDKQSTLAYLRFVAQGIDPALWGKGGEGEPTTVAIDPRLQADKLALEDALARPDLVALAKDAEARFVFGIDAKKDPKTGEYIQQGSGSRANPSRSHFDALKKAEQRGTERPGTWAREVADLWKRSPDIARRLALPEPDRA
jgi:hypothetical protein